MKRRLRNRKPTNAFVVKSSFERYREEVKNEKMIELGMEKILVKRIKNGDQGAFDTLTRANLKFVILLAEHFQNHEFSLSDLIEEGNIGLMKATKKFDENRGSKFSSYAFRWIYGYITNAKFENAEIIRLPRKQRLLIGKINNLISRLEQEFQREPAIIELSELANLKVDRVIKLLNTSSPTISLDEVISLENNESLLDTLSTNDYSPDDDLLIESTNDEVRRLISTLPEKEKIFIKKLFGIECQQMSLGDIAKEMGIKISTARKKRKEILCKLKNKVKEKNRKG